MKIVKEVEIDKEVKRSDGLWQFACGDVFLAIFETQGWGGIKGMASSADLQCDF